MDGLKIIVTTHDKFMWALKPFAYLFGNYWSMQQPIEILCESLPNFAMPKNYTFKVIGVDAKTKWPKEKWTNGFIKYLNSIKEQYVLILLEDYWLNRTVDLNGVKTMYEYMRAHPKVIRVDLTMDRLFAEGPRYPHNDSGNYGHYGHYDLINRPGTQYQMSLQPGIWNKKLLLDILEPNWSPWELELQGTGKLNETDLIVVGTRQNLVSYTNGLKNEATNVNLIGIDDEHKERIKKWIPIKDFME